MKFQTRWTKNGYPYWVFVSTNGRDICWSEAYYSVQGVRDSIDLVKKNAKDAEVE